MSEFWIQSYPSLLDINRMPLIAQNSGAYPQQLIQRPGSSFSFGSGSSGIFARNSGAYPGPLVHRPGSSFSVGSNSSETTLFGVIPPIYNKNYQESRYKTELCRHWQENGFCPHNMQCLFAHGLAELKPFRGRHRKYKTQLCKAFHNKGFCSFGPRCSYIHSGVDIIPGAIKPIPIDELRNLFQRKTSVGSTMSNDSYQSNINTLDSVSEEIRERMKSLSLVTQSRPQPVSHNSSDIRLSVFAKMSRN